jgi:hypothetical protein
VAIYRDRQLGQPGLALGAAIARAQSRIRGDIPLVRIAPEVTFRQWCESLAHDRVDPDSGKLLRGLQVDGRPFTLDDRPAMAWIYDQVPSTPAEAFGRRIILMKCAQVGFTVFEILAAIYLALKFEPLRVGFFLPDMSLARSKSAERFMPIIRTVPEAYDLLTAPDPSALKPRRSEGNVMLRRMGGSLFHFLWTSGRATTESAPMDVLCFDEVQEMAIAHMEKAMERTSASKFKLTLMGSTANQPENDIDYFYRRGSQWRFHTRCPTCAVEEPLDEYFPACIGYDPDRVEHEGRAPGGYRYRCRAGHWIDEPQLGTWRPQNPDADARVMSIHFHQMLSPTVSAEEVYLAYLNAHDIKNFYNRKLGKPYQDPNELPVSEAHLAACVAEGERAGVTWKKSGKNTFMGIDQMGGFNCVVIKERLADGRHAVVHVEEIYGDDPFARCTELMRDFGVQACVVEQLPNVNDARRFASAHRGRVFLCTGYGEIDDGIAHWGDGPKLSASQRRTDESERDRYTVRIDQHRAMSSSLRRIAAIGCLFPDPRGLVQEVREKAARFDAPVLQDRVFPHYLRTALVTQRVNELERKYRRKVEKRGNDPHHSFALMLCDVGISRAHGTTTFILPDMAATSPPTSPEQHPIIQQLRHQQAAGTCSGCEHFTIKDGEAGERGNGVCGHRVGLGVKGRDPGCDDYRGP